MYSTQPRIVTASPKILAGAKVSMSLSENKTSQLWRSFLPRRAEFAHAVGSDLFSVRVYEESYFTSFRHTSLFDKWAAVEVSDANELPAGMKILHLPGGLYAVFDYKGLSTDPAVFQYIYGTWLPSSPYLPDQRPHFEVLGAKYRNNDPGSEEEIWIPVREK